MMIAKPESSTIYYYTARTQASDTLAAAIHAMMPDNVTWVTCRRDADLPQQGSAGVLALFDDCAPAAIPRTLACLYIVRNAPQPAPRGVYQRVCHLPCRIGRLVDDCLDCMRLSAYALLPQEIDFGRGLRLDWQGGRLAHPRFGAIDLTGKECEILIALYEAENHRLDRQALLRRVWAYAPNIETHTLETHIYRLRRKIEDDPGNPALLGTNGDGYQLCIDRGVLCSNSTDHYS